jgi:hypothetical protein
MNPLLAVMPGCTVPSPFACATVLALCVAVVGQQPQQQPAPMPTLPGAQQGQQGQQGQPGNGRQGTAEQQGPVIDPRPRDPIDPTWTRLQQARQFQGFPVFPTRLSGYGAYPSSGTPPSGFVPVLPPAGPEVADWPGWLRLRGREALPYSPEVALLVRHTDRVWWRRDPEAAFVPLFFHDKIGALRAGSEVQVRQAG